MQTDARADSSRGRFQVLALDGGGVRGIFTAAVLAALEDDLERPVLDHFDLVVGTSTGGIIALGLGAGLSPHDILNLYLTESRRIFPGNSAWRHMRHLLAAKYSSRGLETVVRGVLGERLLGESKVPLVIPAYNIGDNDVYLFKTPHHPRLRRDWRIPMWAVAMATSAAPTYFPAFRLPNSEVRLIDGGVWANNPSMVGVIEAVSMFGRRPETIRVLSLGTTSNPKARGRHLDNGGLIQWIRSPSMIEVLLNGQGAGSFAQVQLLLGRENAYRLNPPAFEGVTRIDRAHAHDLVARASHYSRQFCPTFVDKFSDHTPSRYSPIYSSIAEEGSNQ